ncbi:hypothetical protein Ancab_007765 [Ancistrocladus abbreviatus]
MAGRELGFLKQSGSSLREQLARKTLRNVRLQGHTYVDLREDGKRYIFFCTLCLAPCYSDAVLFDHLRGNLHKERYAAAKVTLIGPNPWPFNDGMLFFHNSTEEVKDEPALTNGGMSLIGGQENVDNLAIVVHGNASTPSNEHAVWNSHSEADCGSDDEVVGGCQSSIDMVIPGVIIKEELSDLLVRLVGYGQISARFYEMNRASPGVQKIWCEWLGRGLADEDNNVVPANDFAIVTFTYYYDLGKQGLFEDIRSLLLPLEDNVEGCLKRKRKSFSDPEDVSESLSSQCDSFGEDSQASSIETSRMLLDHYDDQLLQSRIISSKSVRRELRKQQRLASERMCDICQHKMLPGKDVATLLNLKTGRLACSSRNVHGAFHVFHTSCLIHWILFCESEIFTNPPVIPQTRRRSKRKIKSKGKKLGKEFEEKKIPASHNQIRKEGLVRILREQICSIFCPDCQGTGINIEGDQLENPTVPLSKMFKYKIKMSDAHRAWMKSPEQLQNCSTGLSFPPQADDFQDKVLPLKLLHFYRATRQSWMQSP